jgi:uncharacterized protein (TIGR04255 family)
MGKRMENPPVYFVIGQVKHNAVLQLDNYIAGIQENLRKAGYPDYSTSVAINTVLTPQQDGSGPDGTGASVTIQQVAQHRFHNLSRRSCIIVAPDAVSFQTTEYETFELFSEELWKAVHTVNQAVSGLSYIERIGLRYLDAVFPREGETLEPYLVREVLGVSGLVAGMKPNHSFTESALRSDDGCTIVTRVFSHEGRLGLPADLGAEKMPFLDRFELFRKSAPARHAVIDTDGSWTDRSEYSESLIASTLTKIHDRIWVAFQANVTPHALRIWE